MSSPTQNFFSCIALMTFTVKNGAGKGPGLTGPGSQNAGTGADTNFVTATNTAALGYVSSTGAPSSNTDSNSNTNTNAAASLSSSEWAVGPIVCAGVVVFSTLLGGALL